MYELVCPDCGDHPDLDYSEISPRLQWLRGPHRLDAALAEVTAILVVNAGPSRARRP